MVPLSKLKFPRLSSLFVREPGGRLKVDATEGGGSYFLLDASERKKMQCIRNPRATPNNLEVALKRLSSVCSNIPFAAILGDAIGPLLDVTKQIEHVPSNAQGLAQLAARIDLLTPVVCELAKNRPDQGHVIAGALQREFKSIMKDLEDARANGKLKEFFSNTGDGSSLAEHNMTLVQMIANATLTTVHEIHKSLHDLERSKHPYDSSTPNIPQGRIEPADITGGFGAMGQGGGLIGGEGGEGEGPWVKMDPDGHQRIGNISGGAGGTGGTGIDIGGQGGTGKAPVIIRKKRELQRQVG
ncbi:hypothetical protein B0H17DRAFT_1092207 [Mycena rosella]|uniref:Uncharacterized protein n=1 Tax=Mycena rosella TaxID=1033263 RepID=A0AAD7G3N8_MYCRO|nr:hypothetical protein B0H17DRAFT_1092207 [Mycena rosella]